MTVRLFDSAIVQAKPFEDASQDSASDYTRVCYTHNSTFSNHNNNRLSLTGQHPTPRQGNSDNIPPAPAKAPRQLRQEKGLRKRPGWGVAVLVPKLTGLQPILGKRFHFTAF